MSMSREITERHARQVRAFVAGEAAATGASELDVLERLSIHRASFATSWQRR
jgi:hypothetical protein